MNIYGPIFVSGSLHLSSSFFSRNIMYATASKAITASYALNASGGGGGGGGGSILQTGSIAKQTILYNFKPSDQATITGLNLTDNKWGVSIVEEWDEKIIPGDSYYTSVSLLMHFSGSNGSTVFRDNSQNNFPLTSSNGAAISTAQSKFGGQSGYFDGTDDSVSVPNNSALDFGSGDFTIEYWEYRTSSDNNRTTLTRQNMSYAPYFVGYAWNNTLAFYTGNGSNYLVTGLSMGTIVLNQWRHYAVTRQGNTWRTFENGTQIATTTNSSTVSAGTNSMLIGLGVGTYFQGYIDELRITKGVARYTGSFTPQTSEFYNNQNVNQTQTKYIGSVGGLNDTNVDYGIQKLTNSSLKVRKMSTPGTPVSGSPALSASIDRVYVNILDYTKVSVTSSYATNALTSSYVNGSINAGKVYGMTLLFS